MGKERANTKATPLPHNPLNIEERQPDVQSLSLRGWQRCLNVSTAKI